MRKLILFAAFAAWAGQHAESLEDAQQRISKDSAVSRLVLAKDAETVKSALPEIRKRFEAKGFLPVDAEMAAAEAWAYRRLVIKDRAQLVTRLEIQTMAFHMGKLQLVSEPAGAAISVDGRSVDDPTNTEIWAQRGRREIVFEAGGRKVSGACDVIELAVMEARADMANQALTCKKLR